MTIVILDYATLGYDLDLTPAEKFGKVVKYENSNFIAIIGNTFISIYFFLYISQ